MLNRLANHAGAALILAALPWFTVGAAAAPTVNVDVKGDKVSIAVSEAMSIDAVLKRLGEAVGATVEGGGCTRNVGPVKLDLMSFDEALRELAPDHSLIVERDAKTARIKRLLLVEGAGADQAMGGGVPGAPPEGSDQDEARAGAMQQDGMGGAAGMNRSKRAAALRDVAKLGYGKDRASAEQLERMARSGETPEVKAAALVTLAQSSPQGPVAYLKAKLTGDADPQMRLSAARAMLQLVPEQAMTFIGEAAARETDPDIRQQLEILAGGG